MKQINKIQFVLLPIIFLALSFGTINEAWAVEEGGQVQTNAGVVLRKAKTTPNQTSDSSKKSLLPKEKPVGRLPQTGELVKISLLVSGGIVLIVTLSLLLLKGNAGRKGD
ncbi:LPXTG cell wall anchor domain-containing protein [Enterococcus wangshanyuanii]|uniref:Gram-positive cocci surface proteins LPxTG domain-containing protein n=1 Tax=Enterococcus wangshanyuanii TaxID=2005703 RepID=A0ABQ1PB84_9ENTE|nr:LPXTG cell wall anchor domain-containing protein [Enterococcus wangshanyuanii]GGC91462.1 hypothetical protein GCM10011573_21300 [Enterococcus wangshanyuanii]